MIEKEVKLKLEEEEYQKIISDENFLNKIFQKEYEVINIFQTDYYFETSTDFFKNNKAILRIRHNLKNDKYMLNYKEKRNQEAIEYFKEIGIKDFNQLLLTGIVEWDIFSSKIKVELVAKIENNRLRYKFSNFNIDIDETTFLNMYKNYEIEIEDVSINEANNKIKKLQNFFQIPVRENFPKIKLYFDNKQKFINEFFVNKLIIVEGKSDTSNLKKINPQIATYETSGLGLTAEMVEELKKIIIKNKLIPIIFTDPDVPGEKIRAILNEKLTTPYNAYLPKNRAISIKKNKVGIEHAKEYDIINAFANLKLCEVSLGNNTTYVIGDLLDFGIYKNKEKREEFCDLLGIAYGNNKKVLKQLNNYQIAENKIRDVVKQIN